MVIDSHALLWWLEGGELLSARAADEIGQLGRPGTRFVVCGVTFWELREKERRGLIEPKTPVADWPDLLRRIDGLSLIDTTTRHWLDAADLAWEHRDPADRLIAATALRAGLPVITKDRRFHSADCPVEAVW